MNFLFNDHLDRLVFHKTKPLDTSLELLANIIPLKELTLYLKTKYSPQMGKIPHVS